MSLLFNSMRSTQEVPDLVRLLSPKDSNRVGSTDYLRKDTCNSVKFSSSEDRVLPWTKYEKHTGDDKLLS